jgi:hypothetical protein
MRRGSERGQRRAGAAEPLRRSSMSASLEVGGGRLTLWARMMLSRGSEPHVSN